MSPPLSTCFQYRPVIFFEFEQIEAHNRGEQIIDVNDCKKLALEPELQLPMLEVSEAVTIEIDPAPGDPTVVDFPAARSPNADDGDHAP